MGCNFLQFFYVILLISISFCSFYIKFCIRNNDVLPIWQDLTKLRISFRQQIFLISSQFSALKSKLFYLSCLLHINVSYVMEFLAWWVLKSKVFAQKSTVVKWNCCILWIDIEWGLQKLGLILESKVVQKLSLEKNVFNKKWSPKLIFLNEKNIIKNSYDFWHKKLTFKVQFC